MTDETENLISTLRALADFRCETDGDYVHLLQDQARIAAAKLREQADEIERLQSDVTELMSACNEALNENKNLGAYSGTGTPSDARSTRPETESLLDTLAQGLGDKEFVPAGHPLAKRLAVMGLIEMARRQNT